MNFTPANLRDLLHNPAWGEIVERLIADEKSADEQLESTDPYTHVTAIGKRKVLRMVLGLPERLQKELDAERTV